MLHYNAEKENLPNFEVTLSLPLFGIKVKEKEIVRFARYLAL